MEEKSIFEVIRENHRARTSREPRIVSDINAPVAVIAVSDTNYIMTAGHTYLGQVKFQRNDNAANGCRVQDLLVIAIDQLKKGPVASIGNMTAISAIEDALKWCEV